MNAILYATNTGSAECYAKLFAAETGLPVYALSEAKNKLSAGDEVIFFGWIMACTVKGYAKAARCYKVRAVCAVGMGKTGTQTDVVRKKTAIPDNIPLYTLQGNFHIQKLHGFYRLMMQIMVKAVEKGLSEKSNRTPEEDDMLDMILHNGDRVKAENLHAVLDWYNTPGAAGSGHSL